MGPYLSSHTMFENVKFEKSERMDILGLLPRKGICGTMTFPQNLASKGLVMVLWSTSPIGKIHLLPSVVQC